MQEWFAYQRSLCPDCGTKEEDWPIRFDEIPRWESDTHRCPGCAEIGAERRAVPDKEFERGVKVYLRPWRPVDDEPDTPPPAAPPTPEAKPAPREPKTHTLLS